jgi:hypothetical protein
MKNDASVWTLIVRLLSTNFVASISQELSCDDANSAPRQWPQAGGKVVWLSFLSYVSVSESAMLLMISIVIYLSMGVLESGIGTTTST